MDQQTRDKIAKVYELVNNGATDGEKAAAKLALDRLMDKYNLSDQDLTQIKKQNYSFKYATELDLALWKQLYAFFFPSYDFIARKSTLGRREIICSFERIDFILMESSYEYFRRHMAKQFRVLCLPQIKKCRTTKTRNARRKELQDLFFSRYIIESNIYHPEQMEKLDPSQMSQKELQDRINLASAVEGGQYNTQVNTGLYIEQ